MRKLIGLYVGVWVGVFFVGAILTKVYHFPSESNLPSEQYQTVQLQAPQADLMDYHLIMADLAWQRQIWPEAANHYLVLARSTHRADFALMATSAALEAQLVTPARESAQLWAAIEPNNAKAKALTASLCIAEMNGEMAYQYLDALLSELPKEALEQLLLIHSTLEAPQEQAMFLSLLERLTDDYGYQSDIWFVMARQAQTLQQYDYALQATDHTLALEPDWISAIALRVQILYQMGNKVAARDYLEGVVQRFPDHTDLNYIYTQIAAEIE